MGEALLRSHASSPSMAVQTSFTSGLRLEGQVDVGLCNPPYVPTPAEEMQGCGIEISWAGGDRGREMIDALIPRLYTLLAPGGLFYLVCIADNGPEEILAAAAKSPSGRLLGQIVRREQRG